MDGDEMEMEEDGEENEADPLTPNQYTTRLGACLCYLSLGILLIAYCIC